MIIEKLEKKSRASAEVRDFYFWHQLTRHNGNSNQTRILKETRAGASTTMSMAIVKVLEYLPIRIENKELMRKIKFCFKKVGKITLEIKMFLRYNIL